MFGDIEVCRDNTNERFSVCVHIICSCGIFPKHMCVGEGRDVCKELNSKLFGRECISWR